MTTEFHLIDTIELFEDSGALFVIARDDDGTHFECLDASYPDQEFLNALEDAAQ